eukprot:Gregarina_sp_Poly_1__8892@NODE_536_length_7631_cov_45_929402_g423_i0_p1_GENE_NODE_536_length_7631_cov_45_929402_g423_i0NODE_536_length_7631_cov_45_929402_g423_i0_p1_ORF_typecomplete_len571_score77_84_NODE_536_length_7631_cov_45_929402_g423_i053527064
MADVAPMSEEPLSSRLFQAASLVCISVPEYNYEPDFPWGFLDPDKRLELCEALVLSPSRSQWAKNLQWIKGLSLLTRLLLVALPQKVLGALQNSDSRFSIPFNGFEAPTIVDLFTSQDFVLFLCLVGGYQRELVAQAAGHFDLSELFEYVGKRTKRLEGIVSLTHRGLRSVQAQLRRSPSWTDRRKEKHTDSSWALFFMRMAQLNLSSMVDILPLLLILTAGDLANLITADTIPIEILNMIRPLPETPTTLEKTSDRNWSCSKLELISIPQIPEPESPTIEETLKEITQRCVPNDRLSERLSCLCQNGESDAFHLMDFYRGLFVDGLRRSLPRLQMILPCAASETETSFVPLHPRLRLSCPPGSVCKQVASFHGCRTAVECFDGDTPFKGFQLARVENLRNLKPSRTWDNNWPEFRRKHELCHKVVSQACQLMPATEPLFTLAMLCQLRVLDLETGFWLLSIWLTDGLDAVRKVVTFGFEAAVESEENLQWRNLGQADLIQCLRLVEGLYAPLEHKVEETKVQTQPVISPLDLDSTQYSTRRSSRQASTRSLGSEFPTVRAPPLIRFYRH